MANLHVIYEQDPLNRRVWILHVELSYGGKITATLREVRDERRASKRHGWRPTLRHGFERNNGRWVDVTRVMGDDYRWHGTIVPTPVLPADLADRLAAMLRPEVTVPAPRQSV